MFRKFVAAALLVSFTAMATSGLLMIFVGKTSFTIQMHPVHILFGFLMIAAALAHLTLNMKPLLNHLKNFRAAIFTTVLTAALVGLYAAALSNSVPDELAQPLNALSEQAENALEGK